MTIRPYKSHYLYERNRGPIGYAKHHRYEVKRAQGRIRAAEVRLSDHLGAWKALYGELVVKHRLSGTHAFLDRHHEVLSTMPGVRTFAAFAEDQLVSAHIFVTHEGHAMSHLAASSADGYRVGAAYAVNDHAIVHLSDCTTVNFGGGAGGQEDPGDGLVRFKKGFSNCTAPAYICSAVLDEPTYRKLSAEGVESQYFPAYRRPGA